jgi:DNA-binding YbaB/EbfC family protein
MGFGGMSGNMGKMLKKQMDEMQRKMERIQTELGDERIEATVGGGMVVAVANGLGTLREIRVQPEVVDPEDIEMLQDLIVAAVNESIGRAQELRERRMAEVTGGLNIPGLPNLF